MITHPCKEVVRRRYSRMIEEETALPDLIITDGGKGQMDVVREVIVDELHLDIPIAGLAKDDRHRTNELLFGFPPQTIALPPESELFKVLTQIQDEVHRYAITFHRDKRSKHALHSELDDIKGIGPKAKEALLSKFKSVKKMKEASFEQLSEVLGPHKAEILSKYFEEKRREYEIKVVYLQFKLYYIYINNKKKNRTEASIPQMLFIKFYVQHSKFRSSNMRIVIQRVSHASVTIEGEVKSAIRQGYLILTGIEESDTSEDVDWLVRKVIGLRVFDDENHVMNRSIMDINGEITVISQFTLFASYKKGNRPSWLRAAKHEISIPLYEEFCKKLSDALGKPVGTGEFGADMKVDLLNDGPVTIMMDTHNKE